MHHVLENPFVILPAALILALPLLLAGCNGEGEGDAGNDSDAPVDTPQDSILPPECSEEYDPLNPEMKMIYFDLQSPTNLDNQVLENLMLEGFENGDFIWLLQLTGVDDGASDTDGEFHVYTGSGELVGPDLSSGCYRFLGDARWPDAEANVNISGDEMSWPSGEPKIDISIPVFKTDPDTHEKYLLVELPLKQVEISAGSFDADRTSIGQPDSCTGSGGVLRGMITVEDAKGVVIEDLGYTLCGLLSGDKGTVLDDPSDDCQRPIAEWPEPPDTDLGGKPAYTMSACFSASEVAIID
jgi:hypothetical protein